MRGKQESLTHYARHLFQSAGSVNLYISRGFCREDADYIKIKREINLMKRLLADMEAQLD